MKFKFTAICLSLIGIQQLTAQYKTVVYDYEKNFFNEGQPLPAESNFILSGNLFQEIEIVSFQIKNTKNNDELFTAKWKKPFSDKDVYTIPVNYKLKENSDYNFAINYYRKITKAEKNNLFIDVKKTLLGYVKQNYEINKNSLTSFTNRNELIKEMNAIVKHGVNFYENDLNYEFEGFSTVVEQKIKRIDKIKLKKSKFSVFGNKEDKPNKFERNNEYFNEKVAELEVLINTELIQYINTINYIINENRTIIKYSTEKGTNVLPINVGYGAIYNDGNFSNLSYGHSPYVGLAFPLGNFSRNPTFLNKTSLSLGAYLNGFDDQNGITVTGPIINAPIFLGVGTNVFKVFRLNIGATALQQDVNNGLNVDNVYIRPSINLNLELGLWLGLLRK